MFVSIHLRTLFLCIYNYHFVKKVRIHHSCSLNPPKTSFLQSHHKKHQFYALARRLFTYFHLRNDDSSAPVRVPRPSEMPYFWAFSALLPCHQGYGLNMARVVLLHRHTTGHAYPLCEKNIDTIFLAQGNMSAYFLA